MNIDIDVKADSTQVQITVPQANLSWDLANVVAYHVFKSRELIITIGEFEDDMEKRIFEEGHHESWESAKSQVKFVAPFAVDTFHPQFAQDILSYHIYQARKAVRRGILGMFDKLHLHLHIQIADFESVSIDKRNDFAYLLYKRLYPRLLVINGVVFDSRPYRMAELSLFIFNLGVILVVYMIFVALRLVTEGITEQWWWVAVLWIAGLGVIVWLLDQSSVFWVTIMRNFLPSHAMLKLLPKLGLTRRTRDRLNAELESEGNCKNDI